MKNLIQFDLSFVKIRSQRDLKTMKNRVNCIKIKKKTDINFKTVKLQILVTN